MLFRSGGRPLADLRRPRLGLGRLPLRLGQLVLQLLGSSLEGAGEGPLQQKEQKARKDGEVEHLELLLVRIGRAVGVGAHQDVAVWHVAVIGDSTFFHSGIPALINTLYNQSPVVTVIMDNRITGMTGHQQNPATGQTLQGKPAPEVDIEAVVRALGFKHVKTVPALQVKEVEATLKEYLALDEPAVLITREPCALLPESRKKWHPMVVDADICNGCTMCFRIGCPAISKSDELDEKFQRPKALIDAGMCTGCEVCAQVCPRNAIHVLQDTKAQGG
mgnify:CR=1 FL=1